MSKGGDGGGVFTDPQMEWQLSVTKFDLWVKELTCRGERNILGDFNQN